MKKGLLASFMVALMLVTVLSAVSSADDISVSKKIVYTNTEPTSYPTFAYLCGRIKNVSVYEFATCFDAVNLYIVSLIPFGFYHLNSGEEVYISAVAPDMFPIVGFLTDNFIIGLCMNVGW
jgi:hypothetical protein